MPLRAPMTRRARFAARNNGKGPIMASQVVDNVLQGYGIQDAAVHMDVPVAVLAEELKRITSE